MLFRSGDDTRSDASPRVPYPFASAAEMLAMAEASGKSIAAMKRDNERVFRTDAEISGGIHRIWHVMRDCMNRGLETGGILPGGLSIRRRAPGILAALKAEAGMNLTAPHVINDWMSMYAMAVNEENAAGGQVVTAPTNGAAGVVPAVIYYWLHHVPGASEAKVADFLLTDCGNIWSLTGQAFDTNPLFWLRSMDCAGRLAPAEARAEARVWPDDTWQDAFKRGILLSSAKITPLERRENITRLDVLSPQIPAPVRPLYQLWRDGQTSQLQLAEERGRYGKLQQSTDAELDTLRQQQQFLREQLDTTTRKLENLTDIDRKSVV